VQRDTASGIAQAYKHRDDLAMAKRIYEGRAGRGCGRDGKEKVATYDVHGHGEQPANQLTLFRESWPKPATVETAFFDSIALRL
jgi:hypothetical protein